MHFKGGILKEKDPSNYMEALEERFRFFAENVRDVLFIQDMNFNLMYVSPSVKNVFGYEVDELKYMDKIQYMTPESYDRAVQLFNYYSALAEKDPQVDVPLMEYEYIRKDGSTFWGEVKTGFFCDEDGKLLGTQGVLRNIDERKRIEDELRESKAKFQTIFDFSPQAICLSELATGTIREVNKKFCEISGHQKEQVLGRTPVELGLYSRVAREQFVEFLKQAGEVQGLEVRFKNKSGVTIDCLVFSKIITINQEELVLSILVDLTQQRRLEGMLRHAQKMEAVGTLAGGIAHDFNNLLQGIWGFTQVLLMDKSASDPDYGKIKAIEDVVQKGSELTRRLLLYARRVKSTLQPLQINDEIKEISKILERAVPKMIEINLDLAPDLKLVEADRTEFEQVLMNLCLNARDAMADGGTLSIQTRNVVLDNEFCRKNPGASPGEYVLLRVSDTGHGIDEKLAEHIFEPFFTTKDIGKGTGLGLAMVYSIVKAHKGHITCASKVGEGTTFSIYLPSLNGKGVVSLPQGVVKESEDTSGARILLVDDEDMILETTTPILEHHGFEVVTAKSGEEALEIFQREPGKFDLVMLDLGMPGMGGKACLRELRKISPQVNVLIASGYCPGEQDEELMALGVSGFVGKPYRTTYLIEEINRVLANRRNS